MLTVGCEDAVEAGEVDPGFWHEGGASRANAINSILSNEQTLKKYSQNCIKIYKELFAKDRMVMGFKTLYSDTLK